MALTAGQYIYLERPPVTTTASEGLAAESYNKLMRTMTDSIGVGALLPTKITIDEDGTPSSVSIYRATRAPSAEFAD